MRTAAIRAATAHGTTARGHCTGSDRAGTPEAAGKECELARGSVEAAGAGSAITTRICGAEQCGQKAIPSSTVCPHLWHGCSIELSESGRNGARSKVPQGAAPKQEHTDRRRFSNTGEAKSRRPCRACERIPAKNSTLCPRARRLRCVDSLWFQLSVRRSRRCLRRSIRGNRDPSL